VTKGDLEWLEKRGLIENLKEFKKKFGRVTKTCFAYKDIESDCLTIAIYDLSEEQIAELQKYRKTIKLRRLDRD